MVNSVDFLFLFFLDLKFISQSVTSLKVTRVYSTKKKEIFILDV